MSTLLILMILLPLAGSVLNGLVLRSPSTNRAGFVATLCAGTSCLFTVILWNHLLSTGEPIRFAVHWFNAGGFSVNWGFAFDWLTAVMCLVVTGIGTAIHLYSIGYMAEDPAPGRYFSYLNLFLSSMLILVCADNLPVLFVGWEGVGLCSYLLIGFWFEDIAKANAGMKAFLVNRLCGNKPPSL